MMVLNCYIEQYWFDDMIERTKREEYRECTKYWKSNIALPLDRYKAYDVIRFHCDGKNILWHIKKISRKIRAVQDKFFISFDKQLSVGKNE